MRKLFAQVMRTAAFDEARDSTGQRVGIGSHEQMHVIGLDRQFQDFPLMFARHFLHNGFQALCHWANQHLPAALGTPDDVVHHQMDAVWFVLVVHVDSIPHKNSACQATGTVSLRDGAFIPRLKDGGFTRRFCKAIVPIVGDRNLDDMAHRDLLWVAASMHHSTKLRKAYCARLGGISISAMKSPGTRSSQRSPGRRSWPSCM